MVGNITFVLMSAFDGTGQLRRRELLAGAMVVPLASASASEPSSIGEGTGTGTNERHWQSIARQYDRPEGVIQLEHGNWGAMARPVREVYAAHVTRVNCDTSYYARRTMGPDLEAAHAATAAMVGVDPAELVLTRNATEALRALILGYRNLAPGDTVLYADHDYDAMQRFMASLQQRRGVRAVRLSLPEAATCETLLDVYTSAFRENPRIRLVLLTHLGHRSGMVLPVAAIADAARAHGADVIVDAAHSLGQVDFRLPDLRADFVAVNLHKWVGAPLGLGAMFVRSGRVGAIDPDPAADEQADVGLRQRIHIGTFDFAAALTLPDALAFLDSAGSLAARSGRLRALRDRWITALSDVPSVQFLTGNGPGDCGAITSFRMAGDASEAGNRQIVQRLLEEWGIFTVVRTGLAAGACVRVTPSLATHLHEVDRLALALRKVAAV